MVRTERKEYTAMSTWVAMKEAAEALGVSQSKISRLASKGKIQTQEDPFDERVRLVDLEELQRMFNVRRRQTPKQDDQSAAERNMLQYGT
jgi:DNA-binding MarR family transcriptional regulator